MNSAYRIFRLAALLVLIELPVAGAAQQDRDAAKGFPDRPIRIVVPFPPGGPVDIDMRIIAQKMSKDWGVGVVIDNRPGGNTTIGAQLVAKAAPDGYTLLAPMDTTLVMNPATGITIKKKKMAVTTRNSDDEAATLMLAAGC